jgi:predicted GIY-YIG superfamily endonuclease
MTRAVIARTSITTPIMYYAYIVRNQHTGALGYGVTTNLIHSQINGPWQLVYYEEHASERSATQRQRTWEQYAQRSEP